MTPNLQHRNRNAANHWIATFARRIGPVFAVALLAAATLAPLPTRAQDDWQPTAGGALVVAQGVSALPAGDVAWRTTRGRALPAGEAEFVRRPLGFVVATGGPILLVDGERGEQQRLGRGEAALVREGALQQRVSLSGQPVGYLAIELTAADAPPPAAGETVLQPGQPFPAPAGLRDIDLVAAVLSGDRSLDIPDSGTRNVLLVTAGAASASPPGGNGATLLAGEAAGFAGPLVVTAASDDPARPATVVVAVIGPEVPAPSGPLASADLPATPEASASQAPAPTTDADGPIAGSISVQVFGCPAGMSPESVMPGACVPVADAAEVVLSGGSLPSPLTLADAAPGAAGFTWANLPAGDYTLALVVLPDGYASWTLAAPGATGNPDAGYRLSVSPAAPDIDVRIYAFPEG